MSGLRGMKGPGLLTLRTLLLAGVAAGAMGGVAAAQDYSGITLNALIVSQPPQLDCAQMAADEFKQKTGAEVKINGQGYSNLHDAGLAALASATGAYDIIDVAYQWTGEFAEPGFLLALDEYLTPEDTAGMIPRALDLYGKWDGKQVAVPFNGEAMLLFYRKDLLDAAGIAPPTTWEEWNAANEALTKDGIYGTAIMGLREQALTMWSNRYWGLGGGSLDADETGKVALDKALAIQALEQLKTDIEKYSPPGALTYGLPEASAQFTAGKVAMIEMWPSFLGPMTLDAEGASAIVGKVAAAPVPGGKPHSGGWGLAVAADSANKEAAVDFVKLATSLAYDGKCFAETGKGPVYTATYGSAGDQYWMEVQAEAVGSANARSRGAAAGAVNDMFDEVVARYLAGELTAEQAVDEMQTRLDQANAN